MKFNFDTEHKEEAFLKTRVESLKLPAIIKQNFFDKNLLTVRGLIQQTDGEIERIAGSFENSLSVIDSLDRLALEVQLSETENNKEQSRSIQSALDSSNESLPADDDIIETFARIFHTDKDTIESSTRRQDVVKVRDLIAYVLREYAEMSFPAIGRLLGGRDHTTIIHSYKKVKTRIKNQPAAHAELNELISRAESIKDRKIHIEEKLIPSLIASIRERRQGIDVPLKPKEIPDRNLKILDLYRQGLTLRNIGTIFKVTHERVRQIVEKTIRQIAFNESLSKGIELDADILVEEERKMRGTKRNKNKIKTKTAREKRWSRYYVACQSCGTSSIPHVRNGLCEQCVGQYRKERREEIIARHGNKCDHCGIVRQEAIHKFERDFYITKTQEVYCRKCFLNESGKVLSTFRRDR